MTDDLRVHREKGYDERGVVRGREIQAVFGGTFRKSQEICRRIGTKHDE